MPKPIAERTTTNPLGLKINAVMREKGIEGDYATLAKIFDVKTPSVYDWITHGRLGKERYARLVEWSGKGLDWWFDITTPTPHTYSKGENSPEICAQDSAARLATITAASAKKSPFQRITATEWEALPPHVVREIETYAMGLIAGMRLAPDLKRQNGGA